MSVAEGKSVVEALDPDVVLLQWRRGPFAEGDSDKDKGPVTEELVESAALQRALRLLDMTPLTFTHKFGIIYIGHSQQHESDFLRNTCGSAVYEEFLNSLGTHTPLAMCSDDVFTGGLDRMSCKDGEFALLWRSSLAQCAFFVGTLMPNEPGEQINKKRFIGNTYVKIVYTDSDAPFTLAHLSGQFNLVVVVIRPIPNRCAISLSSPTLSYLSLSSLFFFISFLLTLSLSSIPFSPSLSRFCLNPRALAPPSAVCSASLSCVTLQSR